MMIVMDMSTGKIEKMSEEEAAAEEFGAFVDEVLNAGWLPQPEARLEVHEHKPDAPLPPLQEADAEEFLRALYRIQE